MFNTRITSNGSVCNANEAMTAMSEPPSRFHMNVWGRIVLLAFWFRLIFFSPHASPNEYSSTWHAWAVGYGHLATFMFLFYDPPDLTYIYTNIMKFQFFYHDRLSYAVVLSLFLSLIKNSHNFSASVCVCVCVALLNSNGTDVEHTFNIISCQIQKALSKQYANTENV